MNSPGWSVKAWVSSGRVVTAALLCGCTSLAPGTDTAGTPSDPRWDCLNSDPEPLADPDGPIERIVYAVPIFDFTKRPPAKVENLEVKFCALGGQCTSPVYGPFEFPTVFAGTMVTVPLYIIITGFGIDPYIRVTAPNYLPMEYYLGGPLRGSPPSQEIGGENLAEIAAMFMLPPETPVVVGLPIAPIAVLDAEDLANKVGRRRDPMAAIVAVRTLDCFDQYASGVRLTLSVPGGSTGVPFTYLTGQPRLAVDQATDSRGLGGFANVEIPNEITFTNVTITGIAPDGTEYGESVVTIREGQVTLASVRHTVGGYGL